MTQKTTTFLSSILIGLFVCSAVLGLGYSAYKQRGRIKNIAKKQIFPIFKTKGDPKSLLPQEDVYPTDPVLIKINPLKEQTKVSPFIYGSNLLPYSESERDILDYIKDTGFTVFRFPGNGSSGYHWKTGKSDFKSRADKAPLSQMDYLIQFCQLTNTKLLLQVNVESGTPQEAAQWVEYMNKTKDFKVTYWQLGDEVFGDWDKAYMSGTKYAQVIKEYATAMKAVDPSIKIGMDWAPLTHNEKFNIDALKGAGEYIDFIAYHWYPNHVNHDHIYRKKIHPEPKDVMANALQLPNIVKRMHELIEKYVPQKKGQIEITFTGWDGAWDGPNFDFAPHSEGITQWSLANGIFHAETLAQFALNGVTIANQYLFQDINFGTIRGWDKDGGWGGSRWNGVSIRPKGLGIKLMANYFGDIMVESSVQNAPYYFKKADWWPDSYSGRVPYLSSYASISKDKRTVSVLIVNKHEEKEFDVSLQVEGVQPVQVARLYVLSGPNLMASNERKPQIVDIKGYYLKNIGRNFKHVIPARSANIIQFEVMPK